MAELNIIPLSQAIEHPEEADALEREEFEVSFYKTNMLYLEFQVFIWNFLKEKFIKFVWIVGSK